MKDIQEIIKEMDYISKEQVAADLSEEEKQELINLINVDKSPVSQSSVNSFCNNPTSSPTSSPTPTCTPDNACEPQHFCCVVSFPSDLTVPLTNGAPEQIHAAVSPRNLSITSAGKCNIKLGNCTIILDKAQISGGAEILMSLGVKDICGNCTFVCCSDFICLCQKNIICCGLPNEDTIKFTVDNLDAHRVGDACDTSQQIWQIEGDLVFTCENCVTP